MPTVVTNDIVDEEGLRRLLQPRAEPVAEKRTEASTFELDGGPFDRWQRTVDATPRDDGRFDVTQTVDFRLAIPIWRGMFNPLVKRTIRKPPAEGEVPWWSPPDKLDARAARILSYLCVFSAITGYLGVLLSQTNPYFKREFGATDGDISFVATAVRVAGLLALVITIFADRRGRKTVLMRVTYAGVILSAVGAVSPNLWWLGTSQTLARACSASIAVLVGIMAVEEMPSGSRAFAVSVLTMTGALGAGGVVLFLQLAEVAPWAWRIFFAAPLLMVFALPHLSRSIPETRRFEVREAQELHLEPEPDPAPDAPRAGGGKARRFAALGASGFLFSIFFTPASFYMNEWLKEEHAYNGLKITLLQVITNLPGGIAIVVGGRLADKRGRRVIGAIGVAGGVGFTMCMYLSSGWWIWFFSMAATLFGAMSVPALGVYGPELFPTSSRGLANGGLNLLGVGGSVVGLLAAGHLAQAWGGYSTSLPVLGLGPMLVVLIILLFYPETAHKELEELNPEDAPPPGTLAEIEALEAEIDEALAEEERAGHHLRLPHPTPSEHAGSIHALAGAAPTDEPPDDADAEPGTITEPPD